MNSYIGEEIQTVNSWEVGGGGGLTSHCKLHYFEMFWAAALTNDELATDVSEVNLFCHKMFLSSDRAIIMKLI